MTEAHRTKAAKATDFGRITTAVVWVVWAAVTLWSFLFVSRWGVNCPYFDEWQDFVPRFSGAAPVTLAWLFSAHNEHRTPIPRLLDLSAATLAGDNMRGPMFLSVLLLSAAAALALRHAALLRGGKNALTDAALPLLLASVAHYANLLWGYQVAFTIFVTLTIALLTLLLPAGENTAFPQRRALLLSVLLLALPWTGSNGLAFVPLLALWLGARGFASLRAKTADADTRIAGRIAIGAAIIALLITGLYYIGVTRLYSARPSLPYITSQALQIMSTAAGRGLVPSPETASPPSPIAIVLALAAAGLAAFGTRHRGMLIAAAVLAAAAGAALYAGLAPTGRSQPLSEAVALAVVPLTIAFPLLIGAGGDLLRRSETGGPGRWAAAAGLAFAAGALILTLGIAQGRSGIGSYAGLAPRYTTLLVPLIACAYLYSLRAARDCAPGRALRNWIFALSLLCLPGSARMAQQSATERHTLLTGFLTAAHAGTPLAALTTAYTPDLYNDPNALAQGILDLREAKSGPFTTIANDPPSDALTLPVDAAKRTGLTPAPGGAWTTTPSEPGQLSWELPPTVRGRRLYCVRIRYNYPAATESAPPLLILTQTGDETAPAPLTPPVTMGIAPERLGTFGLETRSAALPPATESHTAAFFPNRTGIGALYLQAPPGGTPFHIESITLYMAR